MAGTSSNQAAEAGAVEALEALTVEGLSLSIAGSRILDGFPSPYPKAA